MADLASALRSSAPAPVLDSSNPSAAVAQIYQSVLGRAPDAGAQGWIDAIAGGADPQQIAQQIASSQEGKNYAASNPSGQFSGLASLSQANNPLAGTTNAYNNMQYVGGGTDASSGDQTYQYKDSNGGTATVDSSGNPVGYTPGQSWYQQQYAAHPDAVRSGMNNEQYLALGPLDQTYNLNGQNVPITGAYEYQIDPKTGALTNNPVDRQQSSNFTDWATTPSGALTLGAAVLGSAFGGSALLGGEAAGAAGGGAAAGTGATETAGTIGASDASTVGSTGYGLNAGAPTVGAYSPSGAAATQSSLGLGYAPTGLETSSIGMGGTTGAGSLAGITSSETAAGLGGASLGTGLTAQQLAQYEGASKTGLSALQKAQLLRMGVNSLSKMTGGTGGGGYSTMAGGTGGMTAYQRQNPYLSTAQQNTVPDTTTASLINLLRGQNG